LISSVLSYPTYIEQGIPTARHLVLYFLGQLLPSQQQQYPCTTIMKFSSHEIDMATWLSCRDIELILSQQNGEEEVEIIASSSTKEIEHHNYHPHTPLYTIKGKLGQFFVKNDKTIGPIESLALGSAFVLQKWLETKKKKIQESF
jgi:hypothetical protein